MICDVMCVCVCLCVFALLLSFIIVFEVDNVFFHASVAYFLVSLYSLLLLTAKISCFNMHDMFMLCCYFMFYCCFIFTDMYGCSFAYLPSTVLCCLLFLFTHNVG